LTVDERIALKVYLKHSRGAPISLRQLQIDNRSGSRPGRDTKRDEATAFRSRLHSIDDFNDMHFGTVEEHRKKEKRRRGRTQDTDPNADAQVASAWATKRYRTYENLAQDIGSTRKAVADALDRHRKRAKPAPE
jgi:hypothetical protein